MIDIFRGNPLHYDSSITGIYINYGRVALAAVAIAALSVGGLYAVTHWLTD
jgi:hypothetical protein